MRFSRGLLSYDVLLFGTCAILDIYTIMLLLFAPRGIDPRLSLGGTGSPSWLVSYDLSISFHCSLIN